MFHLLKNLLKKINLFCGQQTPIVRISSLVSNVTNYYSVTDNIFQLIVDFWHMLLVNDDDDVGFSLAFCTNILHFLNILILFFMFYFFFVRVGVSWLISTVCIHTVTIGDQLDELCSFSGSLQHVYYLH